MKPPRDLSAVRRRNTAQQFAQRMREARAMIDQGFDLAIEAMLELGEHHAFDDVAVAAASSGDLITEALAAKRLGISQASLALMRQRGEIPHVRLSSAQGDRDIIRYAPAELDRIVAARTTGTRAS